MTEPRAHDGGGSAPAAASSDGSGRNMKFDFAFLTGSAAQLTRPVSRPARPNARFVSRTALRAPAPRAVPVMAPAQQAPVMPAAVTADAFALPQFEREKPEDPLRQFAANIGASIANARDAVEAVGARLRSAIDARVHADSASASSSGHGERDRRHARRSGNMLWEAFSSHSRGNESWEATPPSPEQQAEKLHTTGLEHERARELLEAVACFERASALAPSDLKHIIRASKNWTDMTFSPEGTSDEQARLVNARALALAADAITMAPDKADGYIAKCVAQGRLALFVPEVRETVRLAKEARDAANKAVELAPGSDIAHHLIGRWHWEMAGINPLARAIVRLMFGHALKPGTYAEACAAYTRATQINPERIIHRVELGKCHMKLGNRPAAVQEWRSALDLDVEDINAMWTLHDARTLLARHAPATYAAWKESNPAGSAAIEAEGERLDVLHEAHLERKKAEKAREKERKKQGHTRVQDAAPLPQLPSSEGGAGTAQVAAPANMASITGGKAA